MFSDDLGMIEGETIGLRLPSGLWQSCPLPEGLSVRLIVNAFSLLEIHDCAVIGVCLLLHVASSVAA